MRSWESKRLLRMSDLKPKYRFPEFKDDWQVISLNKALETDIEKNSKEKYKKEDMLSVSSSAGVVNQMEYKGRSFAGKSVAPYNILKKGQIVYTKSPLKEFPYGIIKFNTHGDGIVSTLYAIYSIKEGFSGDFIDYYFQQAERLNKYLKPLVNIGAKNDMKVNNDKVLIDPVVFPKNEKEQGKIASFLSVIDTKIKSLSNKKALLEEYKMGVAQKLFSQKVRFKDDKGSEFPDWDFKNGNKVFESISDKDHNSDLPILAITQEHGAVPRELINYKISVSEKSVSTYKVVQKGDFIISLRSFQGGIEYSNYKGICSPAYIVLRPIIDIDDQFYKHYLKTEKYIRELNRKLEGIRDGKMISYKYFSEILLPVPHKDEQTKIANFLSTIDRKIEAIGKQLQETEEWKKGLLQKMFC